MHLIFYSPQSLPSIGGLQYVVHYWAEALSKRGHEVVVISETHEEPDLSCFQVKQIGNQTAINKEFYGGAPLSLGEGQGVRDYTTHRNIPFLKQVKLMRAADKIILFNVSLKALPVILFSGKPIYITHHTALWYNNGPRPLRQRMKQWVANHLAKHNAACSQYIAGLYKQCQVIHSPYRADIFVPGNEERIPGSILFAGRLVSDKGADLLLQASAILLKDGHDISLVIVGDGPERENLHALANDLGLLNITALAGDMAETTGEMSFAGDVDATDDVSPPSGGSRRGAGVIWTGALPQSALVRLMQTHQVMVVPSRMEPMGMVVAEGLACGCRMVVSNQGGMPEVGGPFCRYFESGNVDSLAAAIRDQLTNPLLVSAALLQNHLQKFTIQYSVGELEKWLT